MLRLHMNESPYPPPRLAIEYVAKYAELMNFYEVEWLEEELLARLEGYAGAPREYLDFYPGSSYALTLMLAMARARGLEIVTPHPTFHVLYPLFDGFGVVHVRHALSSGFEMDPEGFLRAAEGRVAYIANPNNPTGNILVDDPGYFSRLARVAKYVFIDETYYEFSGFTAKDAALEHDNVVVLRSLSKAFSLAGARFGYAIAGRRAREALASLRIGVETPVTTQAAALGALSDVGYARRLAAEIVSTRELVGRRLAEMGIRNIPSRTNFVLIDVGERCGPVWEGLRARGILTLCLEHARGLEEYANYMRVTIGRPEDMELFLEALGELAGQHWRPTEEGKGKRKL